MAEGPPKQDRPLIQLAGGPPIGRTGAAVPAGRRGGEGEAPTEPARQEARPPTAPAAARRDDAPARRLLGLILVLAAAYLATMPESTWRDWMTWLEQSIRAFPPISGSEGAAGEAERGMNAAGREAEPTDQAVPAEEPLRDAPALETDSPGEVGATLRAATVRERSPLPVGGEVFGDALRPTPQAPRGQWLRWCLVLACATGVLVLHRSKPVNFLLSTEITAALMAVGSFCVGVLLHGPPPWRLVLLGAVGIGYLIQTTRRPAPLSSVGVLGLAFVVVACLGAAKGWFGGAWTFAATKAGPGPGRFAATWNEELAWGLVVFLAMLGALCSRTRPVHFLVAVLLVTLAYHCVDSGRLAYHTFAKMPEGELVKVASEAEELAAGAAGGRILRIEDDSFANVRPWRWVVALEMAVVAAVLLYKAAGIGSLSVAFALTWMFLGCYFYDSLRSASVVGFAYSSLRAAAAAMADEPPEANNGHAARGPLDVGLPPEPAGNHGGANSSPMAADGPSRGWEVEPPGEPARREPRPPMAAAQEAGPTGGANAALAVRRLTWREIGLPVWMYVTAIFAAVMAVSGLHVLWAGTGYRRLLTIALWVGFAAGLTALWYADPKKTDQGWLNWLSGWSQSRYKLHIVWLVFLGAMAVAAAWALRRESRTPAWLHAGVACAFLGTAVTLVGLALLSRYGGVEPMQGVWKYGAIAAGQSAPAWVLLMYLSLSPRQATA